MINVTFNNGYYSRLYCLERMRSLTLSMRLFIPLPPLRNQGLSQQQVGHFLLVIILSAPYAQVRAGTSANVNGGTVDADQISIGGNLIIDQMALGLGPTVSHRVE